MGVARASTKQTLHQYQVRTRQSKVMASTPSKVSISGITVECAQSAFSNAQRLVRDVFQAPAPGAEMVLTRSLMSILMHMGPVTFALCAVEEVVVPTAVVPPSASDHKILVLRVVTKTKTVCKSALLCREADGSIKMKPSCAEVCVVLAAQGIPLGTMALVPGAWSTVSVPEAKAIAEPFAFAPEPALRRKPFPDHAPDVCNCVQCDRECWTPSITSQPSRVRDVDVERAVTFITRRGSKLAPVDAYTGLFVLSKGGLLQHVDGQRLFVLTRGFAAVMANSAGHGASAADTFSGGACGDDTVYRVSSETRQFVPTCRRDPAALRVVVTRDAGVKLARVTSAYSGTFDVLFKDKTIEDVLRTDDARLCALCRTPTTLTHPAFVSVKLGDFVCGEHVGDRDVYPLMDSCTYERLWEA